MRRKRKIEFHPEAFAEYRAAHRWYEKRSIRAAQGFEAAIKKALSRIRDSPESYPLYDDLRRFFVLNKYPFVVFYEVLNQSVLVVAVAQGSREEGYWLDRV